MSTDAELIALVAEARGWFADLMRQANADADFVTKGRAPSLVGESLVYERAKWAGRISRLADALEAVRADEREACARVADEAATGIRKAASAAELALPAVFGANTISELANLIDELAANMRNRTPSPPAEEKKT